MIILKFSDFVFTSSLAKWNASRVSQEEIFKSFVGNGYVEDTHFFNM